MSEGTLTISKNEVLNKGMDYSFLREQGIKHIQDLAGKIWTDHNIHDPGITSLELLCYAISELSYRAALPVENILAPEKEDEESENNFYAATQILPSTPVTINDYRKLLMDIEGIKNAWFVEAERINKPVCYDAYGNELYHCTFPFDHPMEEKIKIKGIYDVIVEFDNDKYVIEEKEALITKARETLMTNRNLCEDFGNIETKPYEDISISGTFEFEKNVIVEKLIAEIFYQVRKFLSPDIDFYSLDEMMEKGVAVDEIFDGPLLQHGFVLNDDLKKSEKQYSKDMKLYASDLINIIMDIPGVVAVKNFCLTSYIDDVINSSNEWVLPLSNNHISRFYEKGCHIAATEGNNQFKVNREKVDEALKNLKLLAKLSSKGMKGNISNDIKIPYGRFEDLGVYHSIQNDFPFIYHLGNEGISSDETDKRKAQVKQMKAYLLFFEQILANYLAQLKNIRKLFSLNTLEERTYFSQSLLGTVPFAEDVINDKDSYFDALNSIVEDSELKSSRRNKFLDHLLARFAEEFSDYAHACYLIGGDTAAESMIVDKVSFLKEYPVLSSSRGKAFDYTGEKWSTENVSGFQKRVSKLLGMDSYMREFITSPDICQYSGELSGEASDYAGIGAEMVSGSLKRESFHVLEHILLRPRHASDHFLPLCSHVETDCHCPDIEIETKIKIEIFKDRADKYRFRFKDEFEIIILKSQDSFDHFDECKADILSILQRGSDVSGFDLKLTKRGRFYFNITKSDGEVLCTGRFFNTVQEREESMQYIIAGMLEIKEKREEQQDANLVEHELTQYDKDPYSFRVTVVLPAWLDRFRNNYFRNLAEQTILSEAPAHIEVRMYWVHQHAMCRFESAYKRWLGTYMQPDDSAERITALNELTEELDRLKYNIVPPENSLHGDYNNTYEVAKLGEDYVNMDNVRVYLDNIKLDTT